MEFLVRKSNMEICFVARLFAKVLLRAGPLLFASMARALLCEI